MIMLNEDIKKDLDYLLVKSKGKIFIAGYPEPYDLRKEEHTVAVDVELFTSGRTRDYALYYIRHDSVGKFDPFGVINPDKKALDEIVAYALAE